MITPFSIYTGPFVPVLRYTSSGKPYTDWTQSVPRISDQLLKCIAYLYPSEEDAQCGDKYGGTGFIVGYPYSDNGALYHGYMVTAAHVVAGGEGKPVDLFARLRMGYSENRVIRLPCDKWVLHHGHDDIAACPIEPSRSVAAFSIPLNHFATKDVVSQWKIGIGDDVFMVGRYLGHPGKEEPIPSVRFGNISQMPDDPIYQAERDHEQESYLIELRSIAGFSGAPVFLYTFQEGAGTQFLCQSPLKNEPGRRSLDHDMLGPLLLGINWGHIPFDCDIVHSDGTTDRERRVRIKSAMAGVVPAWKLVELLNSSVLKANRQSAERSHPKLGAVLDAMRDDDDVNTMAKRIVDQATS